MEYKNILDRVKSDINHEGFAIFLERIVARIEENNEFSVNVSNVYGFDVNFDECVSITINELGNFECHSEEKNESNDIRKKSVLFEYFDNGIFSISYYVADIDLEQIHHNSIFETLVFNDEHKLVHARYEKAGESITVSTSDLDSYSSFFYQEKFLKNNKKYKK